MRPTSVTVGVPVGDLQRSRAWYDRLFERDVDLQPAPNVVEYEIGGVWVQLCGGDPPGGAWVLRFGVEDLDAERERLRSLGVDVPAIEEIPGAVRIFEIADPDGNRLSFYTVIE